MSVFRLALWFGVPSAMLCTLLCGCGSTNVATGSGSSNPPPPSTPTGNGIAFSGSVMAGSQPVSGASVQLNAAGTTGNGTAPTALLDAAAVTDSSGHFSIPAGYACPSSSSQLYLATSGGQVGNASANTAIVLMSAIGSCSSISSSSSFVVNEVTTTASVWALAQFLGAGGTVGATSTNARGLANAVATAGELVNVTSGSSPGANFSKTASAVNTKINTVANLLNTCTSAFTGCNALFAAATVSGQPAPSNTLDAARNIATNPGTQVSTLFGLAAHNTAFSPAFSVAPNDWIVSINRSATGMVTPTSIAVDGEGNIWVASYSGVATELSPTGDALLPQGISSGGLMNSYGMAIDSQNDIWVANYQGPSSVNNGYGSVTEIGSSGQILSSGSGFTTGGINYPVAVAIDASANAWVANYGTSNLTRYSSAGVPLSGTNGYASSTLSFPVAIAIDGNNNAWVANNGDDTVAKVSPDGTQFTGYACCSGPAGIAIDQRGYVWVANYQGNSVSLLASGGQVVSSGYTDNGASINHPQGMAVDGGGHVWVANYRGTSITELAGTTGASPGQILSPTAGYAVDADLNNPYAIAVDASGNLWLTNFTSNLVTEIVGAAVPVKTPLIGPPQAP